MAVFFRIHNNQRYDVANVETLGFNMNDPSYIPTDYLENQQFVVFRTCWGLGDWGIISAMPRKLKEKYPNCKVYLPTPKYLDSLFGDGYKLNWGSWNDPHKNMNYVFDNNPYVDGFVSEVEGEIFHDHFRLASESEEPLLKQMLRFWQFDESELNDLCPELYFSDKEIEFGNSIIKEYSSGEFGTLLISERFKDKPEWIEKIQKLIDTANIPMFYWTYQPDVPFEFKKLLNLRHIDPRIQLYLKTKAKINIGIQCGVNDSVARYANTISLVRGELGTNVVECGKYI